MSQKITWSHLPVQMPGGALLPHMSARARTQMMDALFEGVGGYEKARAWIEASDDNYEKFFTLWARGQARATNVEHNLGDGVERLLEQLDERERAENAKVINGIATDIDMQLLDS